MLQISKLKGDKNVIVLLMFVLLLKMADHNALCVYYAQPLVPFFAIWSNK